VKDLKAYTAWQERMMQRPSVKKAVEDEQKVAA
jgi:glutathione S-transferase